MFTDPLKNLKAFAIREHDIVADLGAGTGFYAIPAARIAHAGKVYAVELHKDYLTTIKNYVKEAKLHNIETIWGNAEKLGGTKIADNIVDKVIVSNVFSQLEDKHKFIAEMGRILKKGGHALVIDWTPDGHLFNGHKTISKIEMKNLLEASSFVWERDIDANAHHYGMILRKI
ncbi:MAG: class I SAM-dependent methyltransferase [Candidatus Pacebacteria bacterium]|jgi:ubiquinone/menaquinone biosynthesis C-methylase UbiE|nr:class I SAM-dependent methyltransferase [Candidatus Paceibacterota bacterium]